MTEISRQLSSCRVLLVDDVIENINILVETLKSDYRLGFALNGPDALAYARTRQPDLILLDIMMPGMDGYETCRRLKADPATRQIPVLFITALDEIQDKTTAFEAGAVDYITKPFEILEIKARVKNHLSLRLAHEALAKQRDRLQQSLDLAMEVQQSLLPRCVPAWPDVDISGKSVYCDETGGDYYDYLEMDDGRRVILVGDVSGHGIQSALLMTTVRGSLRQRIMMPAALHRMVSDLNRQFQEDVDVSGHFMTLFICEIDGSLKTLKWVRAGHDPALLYDVAADTFHELGGKGVPLGLIRDYPYEAFECQVKKGQILVIGTDGIWEAFDPKGNLFGKDRFKEIIRSSAHLPAAAITETVIEAVRQFSRPRQNEDDITLVVAKLEKR